MSLRPGDLLGIPAPDLVHHLAWLRYALVAVVVLWAALVARARASLGLLGGIVYVLVALGFWTLALGRPYGLLVDAHTTRTMAETAVGAASGSDEGVLAGEPAPGLGAWAGRHGLDPAVARLVPSLLPLLLLILAAVSIHGLWAARAQAPLAALMWLAFSTGDLDALRGFGVAVGAWAHPVASLGLLATLAAVLLAARTPRSRWIAIALAIVLAWGAAALWSASLGEPWSRPRALEAALLLTLDQGPWLPLGLFGLLRRGEPASRALAAAGATLVLLGTAGAVPVGAWGAHALYRLGLLLAAAAPLSALCAAAGERIGRWAAGAEGPRALAARRQALAEAPPVRLGAAALLLAMAPGSFLVWWDPVQLDPVAAASLDPVPLVVTEVAAAVRAYTPPQSVVLASPEYAPAVAALAGRRVLRAPLLGSPGDDGERWRVEQKVLAARVADRIVRRYGVSHVLIAIGDFAEHGIGAPEDLDRMAAFRLRYRHPEGVRLYEVVLPAN